MFVQDRENVVDDLVFGFGENVRLGEDSLGDSCAGGLAAELGDDVVEVLFGAYPLPLKEFNNSGDLPHIRDRRFFEGHGFAFEAIFAHLLLSQVRAFILRKSGMR